MIKLSAPDSLLTGGSWPIDVSVTDSDDIAAEDTLTVAITDPSGAETAGTVEDLGILGCYRVTVAVDTPGRWIAIITGANGVNGSAVWVSDAVAGVAMPTVTDLDAYLGTHSWSDDDLAEALDAEASAQRRVCRIPAAYPPDLRSALLRRAQFHLAMKRVTLGVIPGDAERDAIRPGSDPEVRRFERPYRKLPTG